MLKLKGIAEFAFDCKKATLTMEAGATLRESEVLAALQAGGFTGESFTASTPPPIAVVELAIELVEKDARFDRATCRAVAEQLASALPKTSDWHVGADGCARGRFTAAPPTLAELEGSLRDWLAKPSRATGAAPAVFNWRPVSASARLGEWPAEVACATATLAAPLDPARWPALRTALATLEQIVAWSPGGDGSTLVIWTKEPCANLATRLGTALAPLALSVTRVDS